MPMEQEYKEEKANHLLFDICLSKLTSTLYNKLHVIKESV